MAGLTIRLNHLTSFARIWSTVFVHIKGFAPWLQREWKNLKAGLNPFRHAKIFCVDSVIGPSVCYANHVEDGNESLKGAIEEPLPAEAEDTIGSIWIVATS